MKNHPPFSGTKALPPHLQVQQLNAKLAETWQKLSQSLQTVRYLSAENHKLRQQVQQVDVDLSTIPAGPEELQQRVATLEGVVDEALEQNRRLKMVRNDLEEELDNLESQLAAKDRELQRAKAEIARLKANQVTSSPELATLSRSRRIRPISSLMRAVTPKDGVDIPEEMSQEMSPLERIRARVMARERAALTSSTTMMARGNSSTS